MKKDFGFLVHLHAESKFCTRMDQGTTRLPLPSGSRPSRSSRSGDVNESAKKLEEVIEHHDYSGSDEDGFENILDLLALYEIVFLFLGHVFLA